ncbi:MAG TPA: PqiC family protein [Candidatus Binataceae bacterium]|jgi:uncharacterized protein|nr:PqiC family protein [Candidatus Binataceae bacterium]
MMKMRGALSLIAVLLLAGCTVGSLLEPKKDPSQFYVLTPIDEPSGGVPITYSSGGSHKSLSIGLGPVMLPAYLSRAEIVTRSSPNKIDLSDRDRWAEPLDKNLVNVLGQNLTVLLGAHVVTFPWYRPIDLDFQITDEISRFDTDSHGTAQLEGRWEIKDPDSGEVLNSGDTNISERSQLGESAAATLSRALSDMSNQLADAVRATRHPAPHPKAD